MNLNNLDTVFTKSKLRCVLLFLVYSLLVLYSTVLMIRCSAAVLNYASPQNYMGLFEDSRISSYFLGRFVLLAMEYVYAGKNLFWVFLKCLEWTDVLMISLFLLILFQDSVNQFVHTLRVFSGFLFFILLLVSVIYIWYLFLASMQLTTEAGFAYLRTGATICQFGGIFILLMTLFMNVIFLFVKYDVH